MTTESEDLMTIELSPFLRSCVDEGIIDSTSAERVESLRRRMGLGLADVLRDLGIIGALAERSTAGSSSESSLRSPYSPMLLPIRPPADHTFELLWTTQENHIAVELARDFADGNVTQALMYVYGPPGNGKSHLLGAVSHVGGTEALSVNSPDLGPELARADRLRCRAELRHHLLSSHLLLLDDVDLVVGDEEVEQEILAVLNHAERGALHVMVTASVPPADLGANRRLVDRLSSGLMARLGPPNGGERLDLLTRFVGDHDVTEEALRDIAARVACNTREIKAVAGRFITSSGVDSSSSIESLIESSLLTHEGLGDSASSSIPPVIPPPRSDEVWSAAEDKASRFKQMLAEATNEEEQGLALQIALSEKVRELQSVDGSSDELARLEAALHHIREGRIAEAITFFSSPEVSANDHRSDVSSNSAGCEKDERPRSFVTPVTSGSNVNEGEVR